MFLNSNTKTNLMAIRIGPAGIGTPAKEGLRKIKELGLTAAEVEFTYGIKMTNEQAKDIGEIAKKLGISLSVHAPYYINLATKDKTKLESSKRRIILSCERAHYLGAKHVVFHCGYYQNLSKEKCYLLIRNAIVEIQETINRNKWNVVLCPETTGKQSQFGSLDELIRLVKEIGCGICIDFAHLEARSGKEPDYDEIIKKIKGINNITSHFSGIEYGERGERRHIMTPDDKIKRLLQAIKKNKIDITIINESPNMIEDSLKTLKILNEI